jgi:hypothetical protein
MKPELICIDHRVPDPQALISGLHADSHWVLIDSYDRGLKQIHAALASHRDVASLRILAHGRPGALWLGSGELNADSLAADCDDAQWIGNALGPDGDVQIYGCEVGLHRHGRSFVDALTTTFGVPVAASSTPVGHVELGGDWRLDVGELRNTVLRRPQWHGVLGLSITKLPQSIPGSTSGEMRNGRAFAALRADGSVVTWGYPHFGGDSRAVAAALDGRIDVTQVFSTYTAFAALRSDGSVVTWGNAWGGGDSRGVPGALDGRIDVTQVFSTDAAFAALRSDGSVASWGGLPIHVWGGVGTEAVDVALDGTIDVTQVFSTDYAFAALRSDGSVVTWGVPGQGGDSGAVAAALDGTIHVTQVFSTDAAFAALRSDGSVVTWGDSRYGGDSGAVAATLDGTIDGTQVFSTGRAFAALRSDGSVVTWGDASTGGDSGAVAAALDGTIDVTQVFSTYAAFAALRSDGSVVTWGIPGEGGDSGAVAAALDGTIDVTQLFSTGYAFAALRSDGSVVTWGASWGGGDSRAVAAALDGTIDVTQVFSTAYAFAALRSDGSVVTWGVPGQGGDSDAVAAALDGTIDVTQIFSTETAFAALRSDGSVVTWGEALGGGDSRSVAAELHNVVSIANPFTDDVWDASGESTVVVSAFDASQAEGDSGETVFNFNVWRFGALDRSITLDFEVTGFGATPADGADFGGVLPAGSVSFAPGESRQVISIRVSADRMAEPDEVFRLSLANPVGAVIAIGEAHATIRNDDTTLSVAVLDPDQPEGDSGATGYSFTLTRSGILDRVSTIDYRVVGSGSTPADAVDFGGSLPAGMVTFLTGETSKQITVDVTGDTRVEADEGFALQLSYPRGASLGMDSASAVIRNDDTRPTVGIVADIAERSEADAVVAPFTFTVHRLGDLSQSASVEYAVSGSGANAADAADFGGAFPAGTISFAPGETTKVIQVSVNDDPDFEDAETFTVALNNPTNLVIDGGSATAAIHDDDELQIFWIRPDDAVKPEGSVGMTEYSFKVFRYGDASRPTTAAYDVQGTGLHPADGGDFGGTLPGGLIAFGVDETEQLLRIAVQSDTDIENDEAFSVTVRPTRGESETLSFAATGIIVRDDGPPVFSISTTSSGQYEGDSATPFSVLIQRHGDLSLGDTVDFSVVGVGDDPADEGDFGGVFPNGTIVFAPNEMEKRVLIDVAGDRDVEATEGYRFSLHNPSRGTIEAGSQDFSIINDDALPLIRIHPSVSQFAEGSSGLTTVTLAVSRLGDLSRASSIDYVVRGTGPHAADGDDFGGNLPGGTILFAPGEQLANITVAIAADGIVEGNETFAAFVTNASNARLVGPVREFVIADDDELAPRPAQMQGVSAGSDELRADPIAEQPFADSFAPQGARSPSAAIFDYGSLSSPADILLMAEIADAAYDGMIFGSSVDPIGVWDVVLPADLNLPIQDFDGIFYKADPSYVGDRGRAIVLVNDVTHTVALSFRGTDQLATDYLDFFRLLHLGQPYIRAFDGLLSRIGDYIDKLNMSGSFNYKLWVTGHSLGAGIANELREISDTGGYHTVFDQAQYVTFASPRIADRNESRILNIGFENDWVFKAAEARPGNFRPDYDSTTDNLVFSSEQYSQLRDTRDTLNPFEGTYAHWPMRDNYIPSIRRILDSDFYAEIRQDDVIIIDQRDARVFDNPSASKDGHGNRVFLLGQDGHNDVLLGNLLTEADDFIQGGSGDDVLYGLSGNDVLIGDKLAAGGGRDTFVVAASSDGNAPRTRPLGDDVVLDYEMGVDSIDYRGFTPQTREVRDVDGDGDLDLFIGFGSDGSLTLLNNGNVVSLGGPQAVTEGQTAVFEVLRSGDLRASLTIHYAIAGSVSQQGNITFAANSARETITVTSLDNTVIEPDRHYTVTILDPGVEAVVIGNPTAAGTILDDDPVPRPRGDPPHGHPRRPGLRFPGRWRVRPGRERNRCAAAGTNAHKGRWRSGFVDQRIGGSSRRAPRNREYGSSRGLADRRHRHRSR